MWTLISFLLNIVLLIMLTAVYQRFRSLVKKCNLTGVKTSLIDITFNWISRKKDALNSTINSNLS